MYFGLTEHSAAVLRDGERRIWQTGAVNRHWDGTWTLLGFSLPESWQRQRHDLRSKLTWSGFGPLFSGLWIAPGEVDVAELVADLGLSAHVKVFRAHADAGMDIGAMIEETWELAELAERYEAFVSRWQPWQTRAPEADEALAQRLLLQAEWLRVIRRDPRLPVKHLPDDWPHGAGGEDVPGGARATDAAGSGGGGASAGPGGGARRRGRRGLSRSHTSGGSRSLGMRRPSRTLTV